MAEAAMVATATATAEARLREKGVTHIYVVGLAYDYSVGATARDSASLGFNTVVIRDASQAVDQLTATVMEKCLQINRVTEIESSILLSGQPMF